jgi:uncharacterized protein YbjQ (UPF0145 family)
LTALATTDVLPIMTESAGTFAAAFPVTTAFELRGMGLTEIVAYGTAVVVRPASA